MPTTSYTFNSDTQGWRIWNADTQSFQSVAGINFSQSSFDGGVLQYGDVNATAGLNAFLATPADFSGDQRALVDGDVSFRFRNQDTKAFTPDASISSVEVILVSNTGTTLTASVPIMPTTGLVDQTINVGLDAATFGVSQAAFDAVMADLNFFGIDGNSRALDENTVIDNVTFTPSAAPNGAVDGTSADDAMPVGFVDENGDTIDGSANDIRGYAGDDTIDGGGGDDVIDGGAGHDSLAGGSGGDTILGGTGSDTLDGSGGQNSLEGGDDADLFHVGIGDDTLVGGEGGVDHDTLSIANADDAINIAFDGDEAGTYADDDGDSGSFSEIEAFELSTGADTLDGSAATTQAITVDAGRGDDQIIGGGGDDAITGGDGNDTLVGGDGDDHIDSFSGSSTGFETGGDIVGNADSIDAGAGDDTIRGGFGVGESIDGGADTDELSFDYLGPSSALDIDLDAGTYTLGTGGSGTVANVENVTGTHGDDTITGDDGANVLDGGGDAGQGNDILDGRGGDDTIRGGVDDDTIEGGTGNDSIDGGGDHDDLRGEAGDDTLYGGEGNDGITGGADDDLLFGDAGQDTLHGGTGSDRLVGGAGDDLLTGGTGDDTFVLADGSGGDTITDFDIDDDDGDGIYNDQIDVSGLTDADGNSINTEDITVVDDGFGNARLNFPNGEYLILKGISPGQIDGANEMFSAGIPCFTDGTLIRVPGAETAVENLRVGDLVETLDAGPQPITWIGKRQVSAGQLRDSAKHRPICIPKGVLNTTRALFVSPQHAMLLDQRHGLAGEAFVRAKHLAEAIDGIFVDRRETSVTYYHILCPQHQVLFANGAATESFYPGFEGLRAFTLRHMATLLKVLPGLLMEPTERYYGARARTLLKRRDFIGSCHAKNKRCFILPNSGFVPL